jgi:hypothetical protein
VLDREADVARDLAEQNWGDIPSAVEGHRGRPAIGMSVLSVGPALASFVEAESLENGHDLTRLENWRPRHD